jgi:hypothetical protein
VRGCQNHEKKRENKKWGTRNKYSHRFDHFTGTIQTQHLPSPSVSNACNNGSTSSLLGRLLLFRRMLQEEIKR